MSDTQKTYNRRAASILPADLAPGSPLAEVFAVPDFRDVDEVVAATAHELLHLDPGHRSPIKPPHIPAGRFLVEPPPVAAPDRGAEAVVGPGKAIEPAAAHEPSGGATPDDGIPRQAAPAAVESVQRGTASPTPVSGLGEESNILIGESSEAVPGTERPAPVERFQIRDSLEQCSVDCEPLLRTLVERRASREPAVFLFCDVDNGLRAGLTALAVARRLLDGSQRRVLVIDSDLESGELTAWTGACGSAGTRELLRAMNPWQAVAAPTDIDGLMMVPCGMQRLRFSAPSHFVEGVARKALDGILDAFDFALVTSGTAFDNSLHLWTRMVSGTVVTLDANNSSRSIAQAAVRLLNQQGARVIGCLATPLTPRTGTAGRDHRQAA